MQVLFKIISNNFFVLIDLIMFKGMYILISFSAYQQINVGLTFQLLI